MKKEIKNIPASVHARLQQHAEATGRPFQEIFYYYAIERFLYRLSQSRYCKSFVLKGGLAFFGWGIPLRRPTRDIDFQAYIDNNIDGVKSTLEDICGINVEPDGMLFDPSSIKAETIMGDAEYEGVRVRLKAYLGRANVMLQVDVSFANIITPKEIVIEYPTLLDMPNFELRGYNIETSIAEKFQAMVFLGSFNSRMKDYYDIYLLANECDFDGSVLVKAFIATFSNRNTEIPLDIPAALTNDFAVLNQDEWFGFLKRINYPGAEINNFEQIVEFLRKFLLLPMRAAAKGELFNYRWTRGYSWVRLS